MPNEPEEPDQPDGDHTFLLKEYEMLWSFTAQLHKERREAARFLLAVLPGVPAALLAVLAALPERSQPDLSPAGVAPWMLPLLVFLGLAGLLYFLVTVRSRVRAVEYTRWLNMTRRALVKSAPGYFTDELGQCHPDCLKVSRPAYPGTWGVDFWYAALVALPTSAVWSAVVFLALAWAWRSYNAAAFILGGLSLVVVSVVMMLAYTYALLLEEDRRSPSPPAASRSTSN